jgi:hypothetical protein
MAGRKITPKLKDQSPKFAFPLLPPKIPGGFLGSATVGRRAVRPAPHFSFF